MEENLLKLIAQREIEFDNFSKALSAKIKTETAILKILVEKEMFEELLDCCEIDWDKLKQIIDEIIESGYPL